MKVIKQIQYLLQFQLNDVHIFFSVSNKRYQSQSHKHKPYYL